jgi:hypothetical protein
MRWVSYSSRNQFVETIVSWTPMDSLNKLIIATFGRPAVDYLGGYFMYVVYGVLVLICLTAIIWIEKKYFPKLQKTPWIRFTAIILGVIAFWYVIPWLLCAIFLRGRYI